MRFTDQQYRDYLARMHGMRLAKQHNAELCGEVECTPETGRQIADRVMRELDLHNSILQVCKANGWIALRSSMAEATSRPPGEPDFCILASEGRVFWIECKSAKGKLSPAQLAFHAWAHKLGHKIHVVRSMREFQEIVFTRQDPYQK